jgi:adenylate cyclase
MSKPTSFRFSTSLFTAGVLVAVAALLALALRFWFPLSASFLEKIELRALDARFLLRGPVSMKELKDVASRVAIVSMDDSATRTLGHPIPREAHAKLVAQLKSAGAKAIIFDVIFADPSQTNPASDREFANAISKAGNVYLPFDHDSAQPSPPSTLQQVEAKLALPINVPASAQSIRIRPPIAPLFNAMRGSGHIASKPDSDGTFRSSILLMEAGKVYPHVLLNAVAQSVWNADFQRQPPRLESRPEGEYFDVGDHRLGPLVRRELRRSSYDAKSSSVRSTRVGTAWTLPLNFLGGHDAMQVLTIPYLDVLSGKAASRLKDRVVIIGETATGTPDLRPGPFDRSELFLGVETNATFIANLLDNNFLRYPPLSWGVLAVVAIALVVGGAAFGMRPGISLLVAAGVLSLYAYACVQIFASENLVLEMTAPLLATLLSYTFLTAFRLVVTDKAAREYSTALRETQTLLGQYVDENLAQRLSDDPEMRREMQIGTRREVTVLFSDIRGFTPWSERQTPEEVKARLDEYFPVMCEIVADDYDGYVDKFIGDGMMVVWNGMSDQSDHAHRAIRAALSMKRALALLNEGWRKQKQEEFKIGIGVATGMAVFGTFGSPRHKLMPTVLGDTVNLASRLEGMNKETGGVIIISQETYEIIKDDFEVRPLGNVPVKGKSEVQPIYEVLGAKSS